LQENLDCTLMSVASITDNGVAGGDVEIAVAIEVSKRDRGIEIRAKTTTA